MQSSDSGLKSPGPRSKLRVAMVVGQFRPSPMGGAERQAELLAQELGVQGVEVEIFTLRPRRALRTYPSDAVPVHRLWSGYGPAKPYAFMYRLYKRLTGYGDSFDLIHVHQGWSPAYAAVAAGRKMQKPVLVKCGNSGSRFDLDYLEKQYIFGGRMAGAVARNASCFISLNEEAKSQLNSRNIEPERIAQIPNGIGPQDAVSEEERIEARKKLQLAPDEIAIVYVGSLSDKKDLSTLIRSVSETNIPKHIAVYLVGDGPLRERLQQEADSLNIKRSIHFAGRVTFDEVRHYLAAADLFVLPSETEGLSNALLEAMMAGLPCVVSDIPGNRTLVNDADKTGITFESGDSKSLACVIKRVMSDGALRIALGTNARKRVLAEFGIQSVAERYVRLYEQLLMRNH